MNADPKPSDRAYVLYRQACETHGASSGPAAEAWQGWMAAIEREDRDLDHRLQVALMRRNREDGSAAGLKTAVKRAHAGEPGDED